MRKFSQAIALALATIAVLGTVQTAAAHHDGRGTVTYAFPPNDKVFPEGVAYHAGNGDFFVGSTAGGAVYRGNVRSGSRTLTQFLPAGSDGRTAVLGMKVDAHGRLWMAGGPTATMWMYDAVTGRLLSEFKNGVAGSLLNDVAIGPDGAAYFTDSMVPLLYRIAPDAQGIFRYEVWRDLRDTAIQYVQGFNLNGIAVTPDGKYLITIQTNTGKLFRIATDTKEVSEIKLTGGDLMTFGDGLLLDGQTLYVARNSLNLIVQLRLTADYSGGQQIGSFTDTSFGVTTTIAQVSDRLLVVNAQFNRRDNPTLPFTVSSVRIP
jgi:Cu-Zn family superoxide dismutase